MSDLSVADGMPLIWLARLLGVALPERVAGSDLFQRLREQQRDEPLKVFFFGGEGDVAEVACHRLADERRGIVGVGALNPGFGDIPSMSTPEVIEQINSSGADMLVVSLGAAKGQAWILRNLAALKIPVVSHLGAVVNFVAGRVARAPNWMQRLGLEWIWRIAEEPKLWRRYLADGLSLIRLAVTNVLPYAVWLRRNRPERRAAQTTVEIDQAPRSARLTLPTVLDATNQQLLMEQLVPILAMGKGLSLNMAQVSYIDPAGLGLILWLEHHVLHAGNTLTVTQANPAIRRVFRWNNMSHLLV